MPDPTPASPLSEATPTERAAAVLAKFIGACMIPAEGMHFTSASPASLARGCITALSDNNLLATDQAPDATSEGAALTPEQRRQFVGAADAALKVRRSVLRMAAHMTGHKKHPHGEECDQCRDRWPCATVLRAAGPTLDAVADLPSQRPARAGAAEPLRQAVEAAIKAHAEWRLVQHEVHATNVKRDRLKHRLYLAMEDLRRVLDETTPGQP